MPDKLSEKTLLFLLPISIIVGNKSTRDVTTDDLMPFEAPGIDAIIGTCADHSQKHCLNHIPLSPSISP